MWVQTQLAAVLTEYNAMGGSCAFDFVHSPIGQKDLLRKENCHPLGRDGQETDEEIKTNIAKRRDTLPPVLDPRVAIDTDTHRAWLINAKVDGNPTYAGIPGSWKAGFSVKKATGSAFSTAPNTSPTSTICSAQEVSSGPGTSRQPPIMSGCSPAGGRANRSPCSTMSWVCATTASRFKETRPGISG